MLNSIKHGKNLCTLLCEIEIFDPPPRVFARVLGGGGNIFGTGGRHSSRVLKQGPFSLRMGARSNLRGGGAPPQLAKILVHLVLDPSPEIPPDF